MASDNKKVSIKVNGNSYTEKQIVDFKEWYKIGYEPSSNLDHINTFDDMIMLIQTQEDAITIVSEYLHHVLFPPEINSSING